MADENKKNSGGNKDDKIKTLPVTKKMIEGAEEGFESILGVQNELNRITSDAVRQMEILYATREKIIKRVASLHRKSPIGAVSYPKLLDNLEAIIEELGLQKRFPRKMTPRPELKPSKKQKEGTEWRVLVAEEARSQEAKKSARLAYLRQKYKNKFPGSPVQSGEKPRPHARSKYEADELFGKDKTVRDRYNKLHKAEKRRAQSAKTGFKTREEIKAIRVQRSKQLMEDANRRRIEKRFSPSPFDKLEWEKRPNDLTTDFGKPITVSDYPSGGRGFNTKKKLTVKQIEKTIRDNRRRMAEVVEQNERGIDDVETNRIEALVWEKLEDEEFVMKEAYRVISEQLEKNYRWRNKGKKTEKQIREWKENDLPDQVELALMDRTRPELQKMIKADIYPTIARIVDEEVAKTGLVTSSGTKIPRRPNSLFSPMAIPVKLTTAEGELSVHKYGFDGPNAKELGEVFGDDPESFYSTTQIGGRLTGTDEASINKRVNDLHATIASLKEQVNNYPLHSEESKQASGRIASAQAELDNLLTLRANMTRAAGRGTAVHKIIQLLEEGKLDPKTLDAKKIEELAATTEYKKDLESVFYTDSKGKKISEARKILGEVEDYEKFKKEQGLEGKVTTEKSLGYLMEVDGELVKVVGTMDAFYHQLKTLADFKTSGLLHPVQATLQMNILKDLLEVNGIDVDRMKVFHMPYNKRNSVGGVHEVGEIPREELRQLIAQGIRLIKQEKVLPESERVTVNTLKGKVGSAKGMGTTVNDYSLNQLAKYSYEDFRDQIQALKNSSLEEYNHFINILFSMYDYKDGKKVLSNEFYRKGVNFDRARREFPSFYSEVGREDDGTFQYYTDKGVTKEEFENFDGERIEGTKVGGGFLSQWSTAYRQTAQEADRLGKAFRDAPEDKVLEERFREAVKQRDLILWRFVRIVTEQDESTAADVFASLGDLSEREKRIEKVKDEHGEVTEQVTWGANVHEGFINAIREIAPSEYVEYIDEGKSSLYDQGDDERKQREEQRGRNRGYAHRDTVGKILSTLQEAEDFDLDNQSYDQIVKFVEGLKSVAFQFSQFANEIGGESVLDSNMVPEYLNSSLELLSRFDEWRIKMEERLDNKPGGKDLVRLFNKTITVSPQDLETLSAQAAHRFARLLQAEQYYDKVVTPLVEQANKNLPSDQQMTSKDFIKEGFANSGQLSQYTASEQTRGLWTDAQKNKKPILETVKEFMGVSRGAISNDQEAASLQKALSVLLTLNGGKLPSLFIDELTRQTPPTLDGTPSAKTRWWDNNSMDERIIMGEDIRSWGLPPVDDALERLSEQDVRSVNVLVKQLKEERLQIAEQLERMKRSGVHTLGDELVDVTPEEFKGEEGEGSDLTPEEQAEQEKGARSSQMSVDDLKRRGRELQRIIEALSIKKQNENLGLLEKTLAQVNVDFAAGFREYSPENASLTDLGKMTEIFDNSREKYREYIEAYKQFINFTFENDLDRDKAMGAKSRQYLLDKGIRGEKLSEFKSLREKLKEGEEGAFNEAAGTSPRSTEVLYQRINLLEVENDIREIKKTKEKLLAFVKEYNKLHGTLKGRTDAIRSVLEPLAQLRVAHRIQLENNPKSYGGELDKLLADEKRPQDLPEGNPNPPPSDSDSIATTTSSGEPPTTPPTGGSSTTPPTGGSSTTPPTGGSGAKDTERNNRLKEYIGLLKQEQKLQIAIYKLEQERKVLQQKNENTEGIEAQIRGLRGTEDTIGRKREKIGEDMKFTPEEEEKIAQERKLLKNKTTYDEGVFNSKFGVEQQVAAERELQNLLTKRLSQEKQIESAEHSISVSISNKEKKALANVVAMTTQEIGLLDQKIALLQKSGLLRQDEVASIVRQYQIQQQTMKAQAATANHGSRSIWDMMKYDTQRAMTRVFDYGLAMRLLNQIPQTLRKVMTLTQQLDESLLNLRVVTGYNRQEGNALIVTYQKLGKELGATTQEIANSANEWLRQGYTASEAGDLIEASTKLSKLGMVSASEATKYLTSALKGFKLEAQEAIEVVDKLTKVDMDAAVSAGDIAEGLSRTATSAQLAGLSMDQTIGILATIGEVTQKSMSSVGESLKTLLSRYGNVKAGVFSEIGLDDDGETTENINDIEKTLSKLGISIRSSSLEMRNVNDVLDDLAEKWRTLDTVSKNAVATAFAGVRQRENFNVLMENYDRVKELTEESAESAGTADEKYIAYTDSLEAAMKRLTNAWEEFTTKVGASPLIKTGVNLLSYLVKSLETLLQLGGVLLTFKLSSLIPEGGKIKDSIWGGGQLGRGFFNALGLGHLPSKIVTKHNAKIDERVRVGEITEEDKEGKYWHWDQTSGSATKLDTKTTAITSAVDKTTAAINAGVSKITGIMSTQKGVNGTVLSGEGGWNGNTFVPQGGKLGMTRDASGNIGYVGKNGQILSRKVSQLRRDEFLAAETARPSAAPPPGTTGTKTPAPQSYLQGVKGRIGTGGGVGALVGLWAAATKTEVGSGMLSDLYNKTGQTVMADGADRAVAGIATGLLSGLGTAFLGPIGGMLGSLLGGVFGDLFSFLRRRDELERKARVEEAKKQLEALNTIKESIGSYSDLTSNDVWDAQDYEQAKTYVEQFATLLKTTSSLQDEFVAAVQGQVVGLEKADLPKILGEMINGTPEVRSQLAKIAQITNLKEARDQQSAASEDAYVRAWTVEQTDGYTGISTEKLTSGAQSKLVEQGVIFNDDSGDIRLAGDTLGERAENAKKLYEAMVSEGGYSDRTIKKVKELNDKYEEANNNYIESGEKLRELDVQIGYLSSGVSDLTQDQLKSLTYEGVIDKIAQAMEKQGVAIYDTAGIIKDEYLPLIETAIKTDSKMTALLRGEIKTYGDLVAAQEALPLTIAGTTYTYQQLYDLVKHSTPENIATLEKLASALKMDADELRSLIYSAEPTNIENMARALHLTTKRLKELKPVLENVTLAMASLTPSGVREAFAEYEEFYQDIMQDGALTQENFEKIIASYPHLLGDLAKGDLNDLAATIKLMIDETQPLLYSNAIFDAYLGSEKFFADFKEKYADAIETLPDELRSKLGKVATFDALGAGFAELYEALPDVLKEVFDITQEFSSVDKEVANGMEHLTYDLDKQLENLNEQKEALGAVNTQRQKELDLIKAKDALENARKEKKRVYREGVGFTYEADDEAIAQAQEKLTALETEKQQEDLQMEIDRLTAMKQMLENIPTQQEIEASKTTYENWLKNIGLTNDSQLAILSKIDALYTKWTTVKLEGKVEEETAGVEERKTDILNDISSIKAKIDENRKARATAGDGTDQAAVLDDAYNGLYDTLNTLVVEAKNFQIDDKTINKNYQGYADVLSGGKINNEEPVTAAASGTLGLQRDGKAIINEFGTEGIITPSGTLTALPSKTGIVPADITKNLWTLGEVAPTLIAKLNSVGKYGASHSAETINNNDGTFIDKLNMMIYPTKDYDMDKFIAEAKMRARLSRHNN